MNNIRKNSINPFIAVLLIIAVIFCGSGICWPSSAFALSIEEEEEMGKEFLENIEHQFEFIDDDFAIEFINDLGRYLTENMETRPFPFRFYIINNNDLNAFAGPGGHIFIFTGLIDLFIKIDELAGVICHEIAHISLRHLSERIEKNKIVGIATLAGILAGALLGGKTGGAVMTGTAAAGIQKQLQYSRDDERQADQVGLRYMEKSGFDPHALIEVLTKLQQSQLVGLDTIPSYLRTHPAGSERMANIESMLSSVSPVQKKDIPDRLRSLYPFFRTLLIAHDLEPADGEKHFRMEIEKDPDSPLAHFGLGIVLKEKNEYMQAATHFQKALNTLPDNIVLWRYLGETFQQEGRDKDAVQAFENALRINDQDKSTLFLIANSYQNLGEHAKAVKIYEKLASAETVKDEVFYNLGMVLGKEGKLGLAHYNFGIYFKRLKESQKADFHFRKAREYARNDPLLLERITKAAENTQ